ncbi:MAG: hypothetical protein IPO93_00040 [Actinobacteria bacterium]|nr:hypothetical protein [Actinomycetota bacterium]
MTAPEYDAKALLSRVDAARAAGVSRDTIKRYQARGLLPNAVQTGLAREWHIPVSDLVASELLAPDRVAGALDEVAGTREQAELDHAARAGADARVEIAALRARAAGLQALLDRADAQIATQSRLIDRLLDAADPTATPPQGRPGPAAGPDPGPLRRASGVPGEAPTVSCDQPAQPRRDQ